MDTKLNIEEIKKQIEKEKAKKKKFSLPLKMLSVVLAVFILLSVAILLVDVPFVRAYKMNTRKFFYSIINDNENNTNNDVRIINTDEIDEMQEQIPFHVPIPKWLPDGFEIDFAEYTKDYVHYHISYKFENIDKTKYFNFSIRNNPPETMNFLGEYEEIKVNDMDVVVQISYGIDHNDIRISASYINNQGLLMRILGQCDKETLIKIIENMD